MGKKFAVCIRWFSIFHQCCWCACRIFCSLVPLCLGSKWTMVLEVFLPLLGSLAMCLWTHKLSWKMTCFPSSVAQENNSSSKTTSDFGQLHPQSSDDDLSPHGMDWVAFTCQWLVATSFGHKFYNLMRCSRCHMITTMWCRQVRRMIQTSLHGASQASSTGCWHTNQLSDSSLRQSMTIKKMTKFQSHSMLILDQSGCKMGSTQKWESQCGLAGNQQENLQGINRKDFCFLVLWKINLNCLHWFQKRFLSNFVKFFKLMCICFSPLCGLQKEF